MLQKTTFADSSLPAKSWSKRMPREIKAKVKFLLSQAMVLRIRQIWSKIKTLLQKL